MKYIVYYQHIGMGVLKEVKISCKEAIRQTREMARQFAVHIESDKAAIEMFMDSAHRINAELI